LDVTITLPQGHATAAQRSAGWRLVRDAFVFVLAALVVLAGLAGTDLREHAKFTDDSLNALGYRGPLLGPKAPGEVRLGVLGGSIAYGYGVATDDALPTQLQLQLAQAGKRVTVVNLAGNGDSSVCFSSTVDQYQYLALDAILIYSGDNDLAAGAAERDPASCVRNRSAIFRATGYMPILFDVLRERYFHLRYADINQSILEFDTVAVDRQTEEATLQRAQDRRLAEQGFQVGLGGVRRTDVQRAGAPAEPAFQCSMDTAQGGDADTVGYVRQITSLANAELQRGLTVFVGLEPPINQDHCDQQMALRIALQPLMDVAQFRLLPAAPLNLNDPAIAWDGAHLSEQGNQLLARDLAPRIAPLIGADRPSNPLPVGDGNEESNLLHPIGYTIWRVIVSHAQGWLHAL
jgi:lysophospholipase L1-like esterase